jgi:hypothetical protein
MARRPMVPTDQEDRVAKVEEGETFKFTTLYGEKPEMWTVGPKCQANSGRWICTTHDESFANQLQKDIHIHSGKHRMAWVCFEHGPEVP